MRAFLTSLLELAGLGLIVAGVALFSVPLAFVTAGACLILVGRIQA